MKLRTRQLELAPQSRLSRLMGLYADNYWKITTLFGPQRLIAGTYLSSCGDGLDLCLKVFERAPYTLELKLGYAEITDAKTGAPEPNAHLRLYADARLCEVTACYLDSKIEDVLGRFPKAGTVFDHRVRMNAFLNKWLEYLAGCGHSRFSLYTESLA